MLNAEFEFTTAKIQPESGISLLLIFFKELTVRPCAVKRLIVSFCAPKNTKKDYSYSSFYGVLRRKANFFSNSSSSIQNLKMPYLTK